MTNHKFSAAVVGAGLIGASSNQGLLSHAGAFRLHPAFELVAIQDVSELSLQRATSVWNVPGFNNIEDLMIKAKPEVISICSPDAFHAEQLEQIASYAPRAIIIEKPVTQSLTSIKDVEKLNLQSNSLIAVNYSRRYIPTYHQLKDILSKQKIRQISIRYAKGIKHNGGHVIDLIRFLAGEIVEYRVLLSINDYVETDPSVSAHFKTTNCDNVFIQALNQNDYVHFDVDIFTDKSRYTITSDHQTLSIYHVKDNQGTPPGKRLVFVEEQKINHPQAVLLMLNNVADNLNGKNAYILSLAEALATEKLTLQICNEVLNIKTENNHYYEQA